MCIRNLYVPNIASLNQPFQLLVGKGSVVEIDLVNVVILQQGVDHLVIDAA